MRAAKHILVYADGRIVEATQELIGNYFIVPEIKDGAYYRRTFEVHMAKNDFGAPYTLVGLEVSLEFVEGPEERRRKDEEHRRKLLDEVLRGIDGSSHKS